MRLVDWLFRSRATGTYVIVQFPNIPLMVFAGGAVLRTFLRRGSGIRDVVSFVTVGALLVWAIDEIVRGVNPWRRALGGAVLASQLLALLR